MRQAMIVLSMVALALASTSRLAADVVLIQNRQPQPLSFSVVNAAGATQEHSLALAEMVTIPMQGSLRLSCAAATPSVYDLHPNSAYFFSQPEGELLTLQQIDLGEDATTERGRTLPNTPPLGTLVTIPVKLLVDDEEPSVQQRWEERLRQRLNAASRLCAELLGIRFEVVEVGTWDSEDGVAEFSDLMAEFEREVSPAPAKLAIGFTGQKCESEGHVHLGTIRKPLHSHILICEWSPQVTEPERLEVLLHELGHYLGAAHSPDPLSVMRPLLADKLARRQDFPILFDPVNTLAMYLLGEEIRHRQVTDYSQITLGTARRARQLYQVIVEELPDDPVAATYLRFLEPVTTAAAREAPRAAPPLPSLTPAHEASQQAQQIRVILKHLISTLQQRRAEGTVPSAGDALTTLLIREAARAAESSSDETAASAFLMALGIALDDSTLLRDHPLLHDFYRAVESDGERHQRIRLLGQPTLRGRRDLAQHFAVSAMLTAKHGRAAAEAAGLAKEVLDAQGDSGFSFVDLAADRAGVLFASHVLEGKLALTQLADHFKLDDFLPPLDDLPENLSWQDFRNRYGSAGDNRFLAVQKQIDDRLRGLPGYRDSSQ